MAVTYKNVLAKGILLDRVFAIRYRAYFSDGYIKPRFDKKFSDVYDTKPNCTSFLTYQNNLLVGSIRSCLYKPNTLDTAPILGVFTKELEEISNSVFIEPNKFVIDPSFKGRFGARARYSVFKNIADSAVKNRAKYLVAAVRKEHIRFYQSLYFNPMSSPKSYPDLSFDVILVVCNRVDLFVKKINKALAIATVTDNV